MAKKKKNSNLITALMFLLVGLVFLIFGGETISWALTIAGIIFIVFGIAETVKKNTLAGIVSIIIGIVILILGWKLVDIVMLVLGILIAVKGAIALFSSKRKSTLDTVFAVLTIVAGIILAFAFGEAANIIIRVAGAILVLNGILELLGKGFIKK